MATKQQYLQALKSKIIQPRVKVSLLYPNEIPFMEITGDLSQTGTISNNLTNGARRSISITLNNPTLKYSVSVNSLWFNQKFKVELGYLISEDDYYWETQGIFVLNKPTTISKLSERTITFEGLDKFNLLNGKLGGVLQGIYKQPKDTYVTDIIKDALSLGNDTIQPIIDPYFNNIQVPYNFVIDKDKTVGDILLDLANSFSSLVFYSATGQLIFERASDSLNDKLKGSEYTFDILSDEYLGSNISYDFEKVYNEINVEGTNVNGTAIITHTIQNTNLQSPTNVDQIGIKRMPTVRDDMIVTPEQAKDRAIWELQKNSMLVLNCDIESIPLIHLDVNQVITLTDPNQKLEAQRMLIQTISLPIQIGGTMTINCVNVNEIQF
jgi:hypothetical protein